MTDTIIVCTRHSNGCYATTYLNDLRANEPDVMTVRLGPQSQPVGIDPSDLPHTGETRTYRRAVGELLAH